MIGLAAALTALQSCKSKDVFDEEEYRQIIKQESPVGVIDPAQDWVTTRHYTVNVTVSDDMRAQQLFILAPGWQLSPYEILKKLYLHEAQSVTATFAAPVAVTQFYAVLYDGQTYRLKSFAASQSTVSFTSDDPGSARSSLAMKPQGYTFCFEDGMPEPGDYDYNDLVLRVTHQRTGERELKLAVTLAAVGSQTAMGAAMHLNGIKFSDIESVTTHGSEQQFVGNYPLQRLYIESDDTLQAARNGDAVIALFEDAHWAIDGYNINTDYGVILQRNTYNTTLSKTSTALQRSPRTVTFTVTFKEAAVLDRLTMDDLDVFMLKDYSGSIWEVHIPVYTTAQVFWEYNLPNVPILPWAICIPIDQFSYPLEGNYLGMYKDNILSGAYMEQGHSFGEWAANKTMAQDWYYYPTQNMVY